MKSASAAKAGLPALREVILPAAMAFCALDAGTVSVYANDIITTFDVSATFDSSCTGCTLGGTVQFDVTTGAIVTNTLDVTMTGQSLGPFTTLTGSGPVGSDTVFNISDASTNFVKLFIPDLNFIGYTGGSLAWISQSYRCIGAENQRKMLCCNNFSLILERPDADRVYGAAV